MRTYRFSNMASPKRFISIIATFCINELNEFSLKSFSCYEVIPFDSYLKCVLFISNNRFISRV